MKHGKLTKALAAVIALLMVLSVPICTGAAAAVYPVIFVPEMTDIILYQNPDALNGEFEVFNPAGEKARKMLTDILGGLFQANIEVDQGAQKICSVIDEIFMPIELNKNGTPMDKNVGPRTYKTPISGNKKEPIYTENVAAYEKAAQMLLSDKEIFVFQYDWRIDVAANAKLLKQYVGMVKERTGRSKVSLITTGYGGVVANAYMYYYENAAKKSLASCVFLDSLATGSSIVGDVMSGDLIRTVSDSLKDIDNLFQLEDVFDTIKGADVGDAMARYLNSDPTGLFESTLQSMGASEYASVFAKLALSLASFIIEDQGMFEKLGSGYREILMQADDTIYDAGLREYMRNMPGLWAIVPEDSYRQALYFMFGEELEMSDTLKTKIEHGRKVMEFTETTLKRMQRSGVNICVAAGYNLQILPITSSLLEQSDGLQATRYAGLGVTTGDMKHNIKMPQQCLNGRHTHIAPGREVDASTCFFPENTWFIKNHEHNDYASDTAASFVMWLSTGRSQRNIWQSNLYPQYLQKSQIGDTISPLSDPANAADVNLIYGDLDFNGSVTAEDARLALRSAVGLDGVPSRTLVRVGDVDGTGDITAEDARLILRYAVGLDTYFPVER